MALLKIGPRRKYVKLEGSTLQQIGDMLARACPTITGEGLELQLSEGEERIFSDRGGRGAGFTIVGLLADGLERKNGKRPTGPSFTYRNRTFKS